MKKEERYERYKYSTGLNSWEVKPYLGKDKRPIIMNDGPCGVRKPTIQDFDNQGNVMVSVCMPNPSALASSFDRNIVYKNGTLLAKDCLSKKVDILLAPGVNIKRNALCGRNFEYFSEDPFLSGTLASQYVKGLEDNNVGACVKHYCCNSQEFFRKGGSSEIALRPLNEIYLKSFAIVCREANPTAVMSSYNKVNGELPGESYYLLQKKLRKEFKFKGFVMSDWCAVEYKDKAIKNGTSLEMPFSLRDGDYCEALYKRKLFKEKDLIKRDQEFYSACEKFYTREESSEIYDMDKIHEEAVTIAQETMTLVKNKENYLPFKKEEKILVIGHFAKYARYVGGGSGWVNAYKKESYLDILDREQVNYDYLEGYNEKELLLKDSELEGKKYDKVILFLGQFEKDESEGRDRKSIDMHQNQTDVLELVSKHFDKFASIIVTGSVLNIKEVYRKSSAVLISYLAGEGQSNAIYNNIYGIHNPCGHLPETWISSLKQNSIYREYKKYNPFFAYYKDDIYVGYRYYDLHKRGFMLPFGYGLSYSKFKYKDYQVSKENGKIICSVKIKNVSNVDGSDVIQIYAHKEKSNIYRPVKELVGFEKVFVKAHEEKEVKIIINKQDLASYNYATDKMQVERGYYNFLFAKNSRKVLFTSKEVFVNGSKFEEHLKPVKLKRKKAKKFFEIDSIVETAVRCKSFIPLLRKHGFDDKDIDLLHHRLWSTLSDINYFSHKLTFLELEEIIEELNKDEGRKNIPDYLKGEYILDRF